MSQIPTLTLAPPAEVETPSFTARHTPDPLPAIRLNLMRGGYLLTAAGLIVFKWPLLLEAVTMPAAESARLYILVAMSLLCLLGLRHPVAMLPILLFEALWKVLWLAIVGLPHVIAGTADSAMESMLFSLVLVVPILAVIPWDYVWKRFITAHGERWVRSAS